MDNFIVAAIKAARGLLASPLPTDGQKLLDHLKMVRGNLDRAIRLLRHKAADQTASKEDLRGAAWGEHDEAFEGHR
jgi:hypothetical protein